MKQANDGRGNFTDATSGLGKQWQSINWAHAEQEVRRLQMRIAKAASMLSGSRERELYRGLSRVRGNSLARF